MKRRKNVSMKRKKHRQLIKINQERKNERMRQEMKRQREGENEKNDTE